MGEYITLIKDWVIAMGERHEVDPLLIGSLYLISKISLFTFLGIVVKRLRAKKPFTGLLLCACISFSVPYTYLIIAGRNIPVWVYVFIGAVFIYGAYTIWKTVTKKVMPSEV
jgi:hypothetical protein